MTIHNIELDHQLMRVACTLSRKPTAKNPASVIYWWLGTSPTADPVVQGEKALTQQFIDDNWDDASKVLTLTNLVNINGYRTVADQTYTIYASKVGYKNANAAVGNQITIAGDPSLLAAPTGLSVEYSDMETIKLNWTAVPGADSYIVGVSTQDNPLYISTEFDPAFRATTNSYLVVRIAATPEFEVGTTLFFYVKACSGASRSGWSASTARMFPALTSTALAFAPPVPSIDFLTFKLSTTMAPSNPTPSDIVTTLGWPAGTGYESIFKYRTNGGGWISIHNMQSPIGVSDGLTFTFPTPTPISGSNTWEVACNKYRRDISQALGEFMIPGLVTYVHTG